MNFQKFLDEGLATGHGKVEAALRSLNLKYKIEKTDKETIFTFDDYTLHSSNSGKISISEIRTIISGFTMGMSGFEINFLIVLACVALTDCAIKLEISSN